MDKINSTSSLGPDGGYSAVSSELEDEADKEWVIKSFLKLFWYLKVKNMLSLKNKIKLRQEKGATRTRWKSDNCTRPVNKSLNKRQDE